ncbi:MAG TPA: Stp1/IreP family PP2C-type Ser/Thr phosphatase [Myxococcales bacterium]|jgi:serine/threonine protein phosphatase PrpC
MPTTRSWARTDVGHKRTHNEDAFLVDEPLSLFVVADGMGGHAAGEIASAQAVKSIQRAFAEDAPVLEALAREPIAESREQVAGLMEKAIQRACSDIHALAAAATEKRGMGTTVDALVIAGQKAILGHVGDSRVYLYRGGKVRQLTEDHTIVQEQLKRGLITQAQVSLAENRNVITRAVGVQSSVAVDTVVTDVHPGDLFLLCTDGLHGYLKDDELPRLCADDRERLAGKLVDLALERGGKDNVTAVVVSIEATDVEEAAGVEAKTEILRRIPLFQHMSYKELLALLGIAHGRHYQAGEAIIREGEPGDELFVLFRGKVSVTKGGLVIAQLKAGGHFGEMGLVDEAPRSATVLALEETSAIAIDRDSLLELMRRDSLLAVKLLWSFVQVMSERLRNTNDALAELKSEIEILRDKK